MNKTVILDNFAGEGTYELYTQLPLRFRLIENGDRPAEGIAQQFKAKIFSKEQSFIALFRSNNRLFISLEGKTYDVTEGEYKFNTQYLGFWKIKFEALCNGTVLFSTVYVGCKSDLYDAPMDCNIFQEIITRLNDSDSRNNFIEYYNRKILTTTI